MTKPHDLMVYLNRAELAALERAHISAGLRAAADEVHREARWQLERANCDAPSDVLLKVERALRVLAGDEK